MYVMYKDMLCICLCSFVCLLAYLLACVLFLSTEVTKMLAYFAQSCHELVPPDVSVACTYMYTHYTYAINLAHCTEPESTVGHRTFFRPFLLIVRTKLHLIGQNV